MWLNNFLLILLCFTFVYSFHLASTQRCGDSLFFRPNGTYDTNRRLVLSSLASNVSSQDGFYNVSIGEGPERIYVLGLCIPGTDPNICSDCIEPASNGLLKNCPNQTDSWDWRQDKTLCFVRYSNHSFFDEIQLEPYVAEYINITGVFAENVTEFVSLWDDFMGDMIASASSSTLGSPSRRHYSANVSLPTGGFRRFYALMQCIPGISSLNCDACLQANVREYRSRRNVGGNIRRPVCFFRWNLYPFLGVFDNITLLPPERPKGPQGSQPRMLPPPLLSLPHDGKTISTGILVAIVVSSALFGALLALGLVFWNRRHLNKTIKLESEDDMRGPQSIQFDFKTIEDATYKFATKNKIGQGGFGVVYKGTLPDGTKIAVKRLSKNSGQGTQEFKSEVVLVAKLQHRNLVRLLGFCLEGDEQILVYEFVPNKSLDYFLFDSTKGRQLHWATRYNIIGGIARGILYLHQDSRLTIIHRDLKASNILLEDDMNPKIADFGMARIFGMDQSRANTRNIAGTFGYMAPEYAMHGQFSMKSDVYSFGVLLLEIISGKRNSSFHQTDGSVDNLVTHAWRLWRNDKPFELLDSNFGKNYKTDEVRRCIHIGLLCVQENPEDRPTMSTIILMLTSSSITLQVPRSPGFFFQSNRDRDSEVEGSNSSGKPVLCSINDASISDLEPR